MAFIRTKRIKKKSGNIYTYAYLVENKWKKRAKGKKKSRQKVKAYLGRVFKIEKQADSNFLESIENYEKYVNEKNNKEIIADLAKHELLKHGFDEAGKLVSNGEIFFDIDEMDISVIEADKTKKGIVLSLNEGFMCRETLKKLIHFYAEGTEEELGYKLAKAFVDAGINVPKEVFVSYFSKLFK